MSEDLTPDVAAIAAIDAVPKLLEVVCRSTGMGFAAVARVTEARWVACAVRDDIGFGLTPGGELPVATTICDEIRDSRVPVIIDDVAADPCFCNHPTPAQYGFRSYISVPIVHDGEFFGTLCAIDPEPRALKDSTAPRVFELFAELIGAHLASRRRFEASQMALASSREAAELREQFIAVLGHDLRNPLAALGAGVQLLGRAKLESREKLLLKGMEQGVQRMAGLIENVLDLARGRLGGGFIVERKLDSHLDVALQQVIDELRLAHPERRIEADIRLTRAVQTDVRRMAQLLSNLISNALAHGAVDGPVKVRAVIEGGALDLSVSNIGEPIPAAAHARLFQPFARGQSPQRAQGLGLGLWICSEIARAHDGQLSVRSDARETRFSLHIPVHARQQETEAAE